jgi:hypothetical protein
MDGGDILAMVMLILSVSYKYLGTEGVQGTQHQKPQVARAARELRSPLPPRALGTFKVPIFSFVSAIIVSHHRVEVSVF